jgi:predicted AlkP superfamily pyrophosphatase or phosphodiesterase
VPRFDPRPVLAPVRRVLAARGVDSMAVELESGALLVDRAALAAKGIRADSVVRLLARVFRAAPGVDRVYLRGELARRAARGDRIARRWNHMLPPDVPAELMVVLAPHALWKSSSVPANHGAPWDYDAWVPLILWGPGIRPGRFHREVGVVDLAPTLAHLLGVQPTEPLDGRPLREALAR